MMARLAPASKASKFGTGTLLAGMAGAVALCALVATAAAQQAAPAPAAQSAPPSQQKAAEARKSKAKVKSAGVDAKATKKDPAVAQQQIDAGVASLQAGKAELAVQQFTSALSGGSLPPGPMARAHYQRGLAYRKLSKPALAISDLTHALWLKNGLNEGERADALQNRIAAYRDAGLPDQADDGAAGKAPVKAVAAAEAASTSYASTGSIPSPKPPAAGLAPSQEASAPSANSTLGGFFGSLFGGMGGSSGAASAPAEPARPPKTDAAVSAWSAGTEVKAPAAVSPQPQARSPRVAAAQTASADAPLPWLQNEKPAAPAGPARVAAAAPAAAAAPVAAARGAGGRFMLQVAQLKTAAEAQAVAAKLKQQFVGELAGREASIVPVNAGGFGTLHRVAFGPFLDPAEWKSFCPKLLSAGHDCQPLAQ